MQLALHQAWRSDRGGDTGKQNEKRSAISECPITGDKYKARGEHHLTLTQDQNKAPRKPEPPSRLPRTPERALV